MNPKLLNSELNRLSPAGFRAAAKTPIVVVLDNIRSQHNIGAAFRTGDAFCIERMMLCGICAAPPSAEIHKAALGAEDTVEWEYHEQTIAAVELLKQAGYTIIAIEQTAQSIALNKHIPRPGGKYALIFGNEVKGVAQQVVDAADYCLEIPQYGTKHSLNVSVSVGIVLWDLVDKLK